MANIKRIEHNWLKSTERVTEADEFGDGKQLEWWETDFSGDGVSFGVRITPNGTRSFVARYRSPVNGKRRTMKLGSFPSSGVGKARAAARAVLVQVEAGYDPVQEAKEAAQKAPRQTVGEFLDYYLERYSKPEKKSWQDDERRIERIKDELGEIILANLTTRDVAKLHSNIATGKVTNRRKRGGKVEANRTIQLLTTALNKARKWCHLPKSAENVAADVERFKEKGRDRFLKRHEIPRVLEAIEAEESPFVRAYFLIILNCGLRRGEAQALRWFDVDQEHGLIHIGRQKTDEGRVVPLTPEAASVLDSLHRVKGNPFVFAGLGDGPISVSTIKRAWGRIREAADVQDVRIHDLRHTTASWLAMRGVSLPIIGKILGHKDARTTQRYAHLQPEAGRSALEGWGAQLAGDQDEKIAGSIG